MAFFCPFRNSGFIKRINATGVSIKTPPFFQAIVNDSFDLEQLDLDDGPMASDKAPLIGPPNGLAGHHPIEFAERSVRRGNDLDGRNDEESRCCDRALDAGSRLVTETFTVHNLVQSALRCFPFVRIMVNYNWRKSVLPDVVAGITIGIMNIPQGKDRSETERKSECLLTKRLGMPRNNNSAKKVYEVLKLKVA